VAGLLAAGHIRSGEQLIDAQQVTRRAQSLVCLEPLYAGRLVNAIIVRIQALVLPIRTLVFSGH
jgi:hypothetical protein